MNVLTIDVNKYRRASNLLSAQARELKKLNNLRFHDEKLEYEY